MLRCSAQRGTVGGRPAMPTAGTGRIQAGFATLAGTVPATGPGHRFPAAAIDVLARPATLARMPQPPADQPAGSSADRPARVLMNSPLAVSRVLAYRRRTRVKPDDRAGRIVGLVGTMLVHVVFLLVFVLGPPYELEPPPPSTEPVLRVRLIDKPEPPPPPPVRGTPPREVGPRHQASRAPSRQRTTRVAAATAAPQLARVEVAMPAPTPPTVTPPAPAKAPAPRPPAAPEPPVSLPMPAPTPDLQPVPLAGEPPRVTLPTPTLQPPRPPAFQPELARAPQEEGNQPMPPPASLALPTVPAQAPPSVSAPSLAITVATTRPDAPPSVRPLPVTVAAAPPVPEMQAVPLPAQPSPQINLQATLSAPAPVVPRQATRVQAPAIEVAEAELEAVPQTTLTRPDLAPPQATAVTVQDVRKALAAAQPPALARPQLSEQPADTAASPADTQAATVATAADATAPAAASAPAADSAVPAASNADSSEGRHDVSTAPEASAQGSDTATPGRPDAVDQAAPTASNTGVPAPVPGQASTRQGAGASHGEGQPGGDQAGAAQGEKNGALGDYVQLKPHGDTEVMSHRLPTITYEATSFDKYWAPKNESAIDTALRRAVEKTTVKHTFNLPRGVRVECGGSVLLPIALLSCHNPDPAAKPAAQEVYQRLNVPATTTGIPSVPAAPATAARPPAPVVLTNDAQCAAARVAGGPLPPGCESALAPGPRPLRPAPSSSSWVPASDQFH